MRPIQDFSNPNLKVVFTDIDGTLTEHGRLPAESYASLWKLHEANIAVVPITGRPAGWCEMIARTWPVHSVIGENGAFYFSLRDNEMQRFYVDLQNPAPGTSSMVQQKWSASLNQIRDDVLQAIPRARVASDQFCRLYDLAIDFAEDVKPPLTSDEVQNIVAIFAAHGAQAKISDIHVNGWFGSHNKSEMAQHFLAREFPKWSKGDIQNFCGFVGDSLNDEPMFQLLKNSFAVRNIEQFANQLQHQPAFVASYHEGPGFCEIAARILSVQKKS